jgi:uncharacterized protein YndB with AHSA1/START domain
MTDDTAAPTVGAIERSMTFSASPERVWAALTDPAELASWFPDRVDGFEPTADGGGWLVWDAHGRYAIRTETYEPPTRLVWRWARQSETALEDGPTTTVEWRVEPTGSGGTVLYLREHGFLTEHDRGQNVTGWEHELGELATYLA